MRFGKQLVENSKSLQVKQLIYTSFCSRGFTLLTSKNVPKFVQQSFFKRFVQTFWDPYLPPSSDYRAAYLYQMPSDVQGTLFGWLYHDGFDEIGRSDIPYFIAYYLAGILPPSQLSAILTILEQGPVSWVDRQETLTDLTLETLTISDVRQNMPKRTGVSVPTAIRVQSYESMQSRILIDYFFANTTEQELPTDSHAHQQNHRAESSRLDSVNLSKAEHEPEFPLPSEVHQQNLQLEHRLPESSKLPSQGLLMNTENIENVLQELVSKPIGIQGAVLVSAEGQALTPPLGIDETSAAMMAGMMIYLAKNTKSTLSWNEVDSVSIKASEGYLILSRCLDDTYLLVQSKKVPLGLLEGEVNQAIAKLKVILSASEDSSPVLQSAPKAQDYLAIGDSVSQSLDLDDQVTYRGRRTGL